MSVYIPGADERDIRKLILSLQQLAAGRSNATGVVTLTSSATSTAVNDSNCSAQSVPHLVPMTPNAASALATTYISSVANKSFTIAHANNSQTDRTFLYALQG